MPETAITVQILDFGLSGSTYDGLEPTYGAIDEANGNKAKHSGRLFFHVKNADGANPYTVTVKSQRKCDQGHQHDVATAIPASEERMIPAGLAAEFKDTNGDVLLAYSASAQGQLTIAAIQLAEDGR